MKFGEKRMFPVLLSHVDKVRYPECPRYIRWDLVEPYQENALKFHMQSLEQLADRGGLDPVEIWGIVLDVNVFKSAWDYSKGKESNHHPTFEEAVMWLKEWVDDAEFDRRFLLNQRLDDLAGMTQEMGGYPELEPEQQKDNRGHTVEGNLKRGD